MSTYIDLERLKQQCSDSKVVDIESNMRYARSSFERDLYGMPTSIEEVSFTGCLFAYAKYYQVTFKGCTFYDCYFEGGQFEQVTFERCTFSNCIFEGTIVRDCTLHSMRFIDMQFNNGGWFNTTIVEGTPVTFRDCAFNCSMNGLVMPVKTLDELFERDKLGFIVYKTFNDQYTAPSYWNIKEGSILKEWVNTNPSLTCAAGINVAPYAWVEEYRDDPCNPIWKCRIRYEWCHLVTIPYDTDGKVRCGQLELLEKLNA